MACVFCLLSAWCSRVDTGARMDTVAREYMCVLVSLCVPVHACVCVDSCVRVWVCVCVGRVSVAAAPVLTSGRRPAFRRMSRPCAAGDEAARPH